MEQDSVSSIRGNNSPPMDLSKIVVVTGNISSLISFLGNSKKREHPSFMDTKETNTTSTPKKQKLLVHRRSKKLNKRDKWYM